MMICLGDLLDKSKVGNHIIKLQEVSELITAQKLTVYEIENILHNTIVEYLQMRIDAINEISMSNCRPKHHYLSHYSKLFKYHGPLIHLWAMRMESKHTFMKGVVRTVKTF